MEKKPLINKVAKKAIQTIDLTSFVPKATDRVAFDIKPFLYKELILKEDLFRSQLKSYDFSSLKDKFVQVFCSVDAIVPMWAYMLLGTYVNPLASDVTFCQTEKEADEQFLYNAIQNIDTKYYTNQRLVIKGCGEKNFSPLVYMALVRKLQPIAKAISFGEACSMVPVFKK